MGRDAADEKQARRLRRLDSDELRELTRREVRDMGERALETLLEMNDERGALRRRVEEAAVARLEELQEEGSSSSSESGWSSEEDRRGKGRRRSRGKRRSHRKLDVYAPGTEPDMCSICLCEPATRELDPCGHEVCCGDKECIDGIRKHGSCPVCRTKAQRLLYRGRVVATYGSGWTRSLSPGGRARSGSIRTNVSDDGGWDWGEICTIIGVVAAIATGFLLLVVIAAASVNEFVENRVDDATKDSLDQSGMVLTMFLVGLAGVGIAILVAPLFFGARSITAGFFEDKDDDELTACELAICILLWLVVCGAIICLIPLGMAAAGDAPYGHVLFSLFFSVLFVAIFITMMEYMWFGCYDDEEDEDDRLPIALIVFAVISAQLLSAFVTFKFLTAGEDPSFLDPFEVAHGASMILGVFGMPFMVPCLPTFFPAVFPLVAQAP